MSQMIRVEPIPSVPKLVVWVALLLSVMVGGPYAAGVAQAMADADGERVTHEVTK